MNIEALANDLNTVFAKHGIAGEIQAALAGLLMLAASPGGRHLIDRHIASATLFAVDDTSSTVFCRESPMSHNAGLLRALLVSVAPCQLRGVLTAVVEEISDVMAQSSAPKPCNCSLCAPPIFDLNKVVNEQFHLIFADNGSTS